MNDATSVRSKSEDLGFVNVGHHYHDRDCNSKKKLFKQKKAIR